MGMEEVICSIPFLNILSPSMVMELPAIHCSLNKTPYHKNPIAMPATTAAAMANQLVFLIVSRIDFEVN